MVIFTTNNKCIMYLLVLKATMDYNTSCPIVFCHSNIQHKELASPIVSYINLQVTLLIGYIFLFSFTLMYIYNTTNIM